MDAGKHFANLDANCTWQNKVNNYPHFNAGVGFLLQLPNGLIGKTTSSLYIWNTYKREKRDSEERNRGEKVQKKTYRARRRRTHRKNIQGGVSVHLLVPLLSVLPVT